MTLVADRNRIINRTGPIILITAAYCFFYYSTISGLWRIWLTSEEYSYALAIPFVSGFVIWKRRRQIAAAPVTTYWPGVAIFGLFWLISLYGILGSSPSAVRPAALMVLLAIVLFCYGRRQAGILAFPLALLVFLLPLPTVVETGIAVPLRFLSTWLGEFLLRAVGVSVYVEGNIIDLGVTQLQVVDACSGLRYLLPLTALGVIYAYFREKIRWRQAILVLATTPIAVFSNGVRIAVTGYLAQNYSLDSAEGFFHGFSGWLIFVFAVLVLVLLHVVLRTGKAEKSSVEIDLPPARRPDIDKHRFFPSVSMAAAAITCFFLLFGGILAISVAKLPPVRLPKAIASFPLLFDKWQGRSETVDSLIIELSGAQEAFNAAYFSTSGEIVSLYIGYRGSPFTESENFFHSPDVCLPSLGWQTIETGNHTIREVPGVGQITVRRMLIEKTGVRQLVYYWFQTTHRMSANVHLNRLHLTLHALARDNTYDLFLRPITPLQPLESISSAEARLDGFVRSLMAALVPFLSRIE